MSIDIFDWRLSDRAARLYSGIRPYLRADDAVLDIGCGNAPLAHLALPETPGLRWVGIDNHGAAVLELQKELPTGRWLRADYPAIDWHALGGGWGGIVHIGVDSAHVSPISKIHGDLIRAGERPRFVLLEASYSEAYSGPYEAYIVAVTAWQDAGYAVGGGGTFDFDVAGHHLRERVWTLLVRK